MLMDTYPYTAEFLGFPGHCHIAGKSGFNLAIVNMMLTKEK